MQYWPKLIYCQLKQLSYFIEPQIIDRFSIWYLRSVNGDHSNLLLYSRGILLTFCIRNMILKLNMRALKWPANCFKTSKSQPNFKGKCYAEWHQGAAVLTNLDGS